MPIRLATLLLWLCCSTHAVFAQSWVTEQVRAAEPSIARIEVDTKSADGSLSSQRGGTGFFVSSQGHLVTAAHLVSMSDNSPFNGTIRVFTVRGSKTAFGAEVLHVDPRLDVAVLRLLDAGSVVPLRFGRSISAQEGDELAFAGYPAGTWTYNSARLTNIGVERGMWGIEMPTSGGSSGAPLMDRCGRVLAFVRGAPAQTAHHQSVVVPQAEFFDLVRNYAELDTSTCAATGAPAPRANVARRPDAVAGRSSAARSQPPLPPNSQSAACVRAGKNFCLTMSPCQAQGPWLTCQMRVMMDAGTPDHLEKRRMISGYTDGLTLDRSRAHIEFPDGNRATALDLNNTETISQTFRGGDALDVVLRVPRPYGPIPRVRIFVDGLVGPLRRGAQQVPFTSVFGQIEVLATP